MTVTSPVSDPVAKTPAVRRRGRPIPASQCVGIVTACEGETFSIVSGGMQATGRRAASCLLEPASGDSVACLLVAPDEFWILAVLQREEGVGNTIRCAGPTSIDTGGAPLTLCGETVRIQSHRFALDTSQATVSADDAEVVGRDLRVVGSTLKLVGSLLNTVFDRVTHFSRMHLRTTDGLDRVQATQMELKANKTLQVSSEHALIQGEKLVKTRGGQIHFG